MPRYEATECGMELSILEETTGEGAEDSANKQTNKQQTKDKNK
jgi:hypothetical protein